jgi:hypothetical protein
MGKKPEHRKRVNMEKEVFDLLCKFRSQGLFQGLVIDKMNNKEKKRM